VWEAIVIIVALFLNESASSHLSVVSKVADGDVIYKVSLGDKTPRGMVKFLSITFLWRSDMDAGNAKEVVESGRRLPLFLNGVDARATHKFEAFKMVNWQIWEALIG